MVRACIISLTLLLLLLLLICFLFVCLVGCLSAYLHAVLFCMHMKQNTFCSGSWLCSKTHPKEIEYNTVQYTRQ
ncbi:MAG: hypothetical protein JOS17DRAFT_740929 [Linnemannia elongata]|nr:MAG: hypothetical protein JOS17DRAFT_740929 [Linnemannia elongata]